MGQAARVRVQEMFGWERCVGAYHAPCQRLIIKRRKRFPNSNVEPSGKPG